MKRILMMGAVLCAFSVPAFAQSAMPVPQNPQLTTKNANGTVTVDEKEMANSLCQSMQLLSTPESIGFQMPPRIDMPVTAKDLAGFGVAQPVIPEGQTVTVSLLQGGQVLVNNQDVTPQIKTFCAAHGMALPEKTNTSQTGH